MRHLIGSGDDKQKQAVQLFAHYARLSDHLIKARQHLGSRQKVYALLGNGGRYYYLRGYFFLGLQLLSSVGFQQVRQTFQVQDEQVGPQV